MQKTYHGSCDGGAVSIETDIDLAPGAGRCNGSICTKTRQWSVIVKPEAFRLKSGESDLTDYPFATRSMHYPYCKHCGVRLFGQGHLDVLGGDFYSIYLASLDDAEPTDLIDAPLHFSDGRHNNGPSVPAETRHL